ncbi:LuxR C-terminal-related transcriptional regulator [Nocardia sp. NPDC005978]|uniref:LuxR C-terminal-related transcriptional regulator n=1 Tax=Nocardia sp. NPDC005978 TaxID=3156725 RepID=UPI00339F36EA
MTKPGTTGSSAHRGTATGGRDGIPSFAFTPLARTAHLKALNRDALDSDANVLLICSPVGTGKTVLLSQWTARQSARKFPGGVAWLTLSGAPHVTPNLWQRLRTMWDLPGPARGPLTTPMSEAADLADALAARAQPALLIIDDAHLATDPVTLAGLEHFLLHAPACVRTIVAARFEPPIRWHLLDLSSQLRRWTGADLAFSAAETEQICRQHGCELDDSGIGLLTDLTRGWAALVRIAAIFLAAREEEPATALAALAVPPTSISDLLAGELISTLSPGLRLFLTYTSVPAEFTGQLADDLVGGGAAQWMHELTRQNYPITSVTRGGTTWFAYHPLLRAYFQAELNRLGPGVAEELHLRTALYLRAAGEPALALAHLLKVPHRAPLLDFLREQALAMILDGQGESLFDGLAGLDARLLADPFVRLLHVVDALARTDIAAARAYREALEHRGAQADSLVDQDTITALRDAVDIELALATGTLADLGGGEIRAATGQPDVDCYLAVESATARFAHGDLPEAEQRLRAAIAVADVRAHPRLRLRASTRLAMAAGLAGSLTLMRQRADSAVHFAREHDLGHTAEAANAAALAALGGYLQGAIRESDGPTPALAEQQLLDGSTGPAGGWPTYLVATLAASDNTDDHSRDAELLRHGFSRLLDTHPTMMSGGLIPFIVWRLLAVRETYEAQLLVDQARAVLGESPDIAVSQAALESAAHRSRVVLDLVQPLLADPATHTVLAVTAWLLHARAHDELGGKVQARQSLANALRTGAPEQIVRPFLDVPGALTLLDAFAESFGQHNAFASTIRRHPLVNRLSRHPTLTDTELKVLRQLPSARTTQQIAEDLGVSINTVKTHLRGIYAKLGTNSRMQVMVVARRSGLL